VAWQGGEPTLMKLDFFRRSVELVEEYRRPGQVVQHTFQTNGILVDDETGAPSSRNTTRLPRMDPRTVRLVAASSLRSRLRASPSIPRSFRLRIPCAWPSFSGIGTGEYLLTYKD
jgi:hypothetical protein